MIRGMGLDEILKNSYEMFFQSAREFEFLLAKPYKVNRVFWLRKMKTQYFFNKNMMAKKS